MPTKLWPAYLLRDESAGRLNWSKLPCHGSQVHHSHSPGLTSLLLISGRATQEFPIGRRRNIIWSHARSRGFREGSPGVKRLKLSLKPAELLCHSKLGGTDRRVTHFCYFLSFDHHHDTQTHICSWGACLPRMNLVKIEIRFFWGG